VIAAHGLAAEAGLQLCEPGLVQDDFVGDSGHGP
jgi:hypothetical protein